MEVILLERIERLGQMGDTVNVKPGFARNFLLPQKKALRATAENKARFEAERAQLEAENLKLKSEADSVAGKIEGLSVVLVRQAGDAGQLYGSVNARDVADAVTEAGFTVGRNQVVLDKPIKALGLYAVRLNLHAEVNGSVTVNVARSQEEAEIQAETGGAVLSIDEQEKAEEAAAIAAAAEEVFEEEAADIDEVVAETEAAVEAVAEVTEAAEVEAAEADAGDAAAEDEEEAKA